MGSVGATNLVAPTTASAPDVPHFAPPRGGRWSLCRRTAPSINTSGPVRSDVAVLDSFPPREPTSRLADKGRLGSLGGWRAGLSAPAAAYPPLLHT